MTIKGTIFYQPSQHKHILAIFHKLPSVQDKLSVPPHSTGPVVAVRRGKHSSRIFLTTSMTINHRNGTQRTSILLYRCVASGENNIHQNRKIYFFKSFFSKKLLIIFKQKILCYNNRKLVL